jgi:plasmid stabilization system protein ParE
MARVVFTAAADADAAFIFDDLYAKAGKSTVVKYRAAFRTLYEHLAAFPDSGAPYGSPSLRGALATKQSRAAVRHSPRSLRGRRGRSEVFVRRPLDCFASLAMTG